MYKIKNLVEFYNRMIDKEEYKYGEKLKFIHDKEIIHNNDEKLLDFILKYSEIIKYANSNDYSNYNYRYYERALNEAYISLSNSGIDELFEILNNSYVEFEDSNEKEEILFTDEEPKIEFELKKIENGEYVITPNIDIYNIKIFKGKNYKYIIKDKKMHRCSKEFENTQLRLVNMFKENYMTEVKLGEEGLAQLFSIVLPKVKNAITIKNIEKEKIEKYKPKELGVKVFLDYDEKDYLIVDVKFCYGEVEFNPLHNEKVEVPRNMIKEAMELRVFTQSGFLLDNEKNRFILPDDDKIYKFLTEDINMYMEKFEVLVTDKFKVKQINQPRIGSLGIKVENNLLSIDLSEIDIDVKELEELMSKYELKKKYHRLKDGSFINLEENKEIEFLDKLVTGMDLDYKNLENGEIQLPIHRSLYLNQLLKGMKGTEIIKNSEYKNIVNNLNKEQLEDDIEVPKQLNDILRYYQKTGFKWLSILDKYRFGGILADDMGLGKTVQMLALIIHYVQNKNDENKTKASLVVSPSSLTLNWKNEAGKFAKDLKILVINGTLIERMEKINEIENYDLVITSYDLLKRDIELYEEKKYNFKYIIADEAQYLKNSNTQNAKAVKKIKAETRYALTGTPIENALSELWSIFDFVMPGYLFNYKKFKNMYEMPIVRDNSQDAMEKLRMLIEPFVLRRNKKEVLTELPDKTITILNNEMEEEQKNIYLACLAQTKKELMQEISINGFEKSQIQILAALTRLRQICCHPGLFIDKYKGGSSKLEQCMEIIEEAVESGHKILLFSGYTSMFEFIEKKLDKNSIKYFKLTGKTKVDKRIELVDEFNKNPEIQVFLISLKAGGTGLNLTGADMVIHYDPWWNLSTENQATDRSYRIGQKNNVQVYKLITKNSIEEKIYELQQKKAELVDNMLSTKTSFINKFSKDDIMRLFEE